MTMQFQVLVDTHDDPTATPGAFALAIYRAIEYALDNDIEGAEVLDRYVVGQVQVVEQ